MPAIMAGRRFWAGLSPMPKADPESHKSVVEIQQKSKRRLAMTYRIMTWAAVAWIAAWLTPYLYAVNDLITWRQPSVASVEVIRTTQ